MSQYCDDFKFSENNPDHFVFGPQSDDHYQFWQGLRGPYYTPAVGEDGYLYWTNNGQLPNPEPVKIVGKDGRGITLTGQCATVAELPEDPEQGEAWAVGAEEPFECYAWFGEWIDMGLMFPAGQDGVSPTVTISATATGHKVKITDRNHPSGQEFNVDDGEDGDPGQDGISPAVTITTTSTGHKVKITDRNHPSGQEFNVDDGEDGDPGPGVPPGGSKGQFYRKASGTDYDGEWHTLSAGDSSYDSSLTYEAGTVGKELGDQKNTLTQLKTDTFGNINLTGTNNTGSTITAGTFFYNNGALVRAKTDIQNGSAITIGTNAETVTAGGLNVLNNNLVPVVETLAPGVYTYYWEALKLLRIYFNNISPTYTASDHNIIATVPSKYRNFSRNYYNTGISVSNIEGNIHTVMLEAFSADTVYPEWRWGVGIFTTEQNLSRFRGFVDVMFD